MLAGKVEIKMVVKLVILCTFKCDPKKTYINGKLIYSAFR